jgi:thioredoxin-related protein
MRFLLYISIVLSLSVTSFSQAINWIEFNDLSLNMRKEPKSILIFIYTDWCKFCKMQEATTFADKMIVDNFNTNYYCLKLNAEEKKKIKFLNKTYNFKSTGVNTGEHELAAMLGKEDNRITYPTTVFLSSRFELLTKLVGFQSSKDLKEIE